MPRIIDCPPDEAPLALGDLIAALNDEAFDPTDEDSFAAAGPLLKRLAGNRDFLADIALAELKDRCTRQREKSAPTRVAKSSSRASCDPFRRAVSASTGVVHNLDTSGEGSAEALRAP